jgi:inward rectifier potassium channel
VSHPSNPPPSTHHSRRREAPKDLGFGSVVSDESRLRLLNRDGSFNVRRTGLKYFESMSLYHTLLTISWPRLLTLISAFYVAVNLVFGALFWTLGPQALNGTSAAMPEGSYLRAFFFSVQTFGTIGYGQVGPVGLVPNLLVTLESLCGLISLALITGILFARFSRPTAAILFSRKALIAPFGEGKAFEFRITNRRTNQLIDLHARVLFSRIRRQDGRAMRDYAELTLERQSVVFFPLAWTVVHVIDENSPLWGVTPEQMAADESEFLVLLEGTDETFAQRVHARTSYKPTEIVWNARFADMFDRRGLQDGLSIDIGRLHDYDPV